MNKLIKYVVIIILIGFSVNCNAQIVNFRSLVTEEIEMNAYNANMQKEGLWNYYHDDITKISVGQYINGTQSGVWFTCNYMFQLETVEIYKQDSLLVSFDFTKGGRQLGLEVHDSSFVINKLNVQGFEHPIKSSDLSQSEFFEKFPELPYLHLNIKYVDGISFSISKGAHHTPYIATLRLPIGPGEFQVFNFFNYDKKNMEKWYLNEVFGIEKGLLNGEYLIFNHNDSSGIYCRSNYDNGLISGTISVLKGNGINWFSSGEEAPVVNVYQGKYKKIKGKDINSLSDFYRMKKRFIYPIRLVYYIWSYPKDLYEGFRGTLGSEKDYIKD